MKLTKTVLCVLLLSLILLTDFIGSLFAGGVASDRRIAVRHVFIEDTRVNKGIERYAAECFKILGFGESMYIKNLEDSSYVSRPIAENTIPSASDGLINPNDPIKLYAFRDKVSFGFSIEADWDEDFLIRVFDDSGKLLGSFSGSEVDYGNDEKGFELYPSKDARNYYVEFSYDKALRKRMNGSLNMTPSAAFGLSIGLPIPHVPVPSPRITIPDGSKKSSKSKPSSSSRKSSKSKSNAEDREYCYILFSLSTFEPDILPEEVKEVEGVVQKYMRENNKSSYSELDDYEVSGILIDELRGYFWEKQIHFSNVSDYRVNLSRMSLSEIDKRSMKYLTKNRISSIESMTDAQIIALQASIMEGDFARIPEYSRLMKDYKSKHGIKSYENMTINELNRLQRVISRQSATMSEQYRKQQTQTQKKPSGSKAKKKSR